MKSAKNKIIFIAMGGLGNQLFQFANAFALGKEYNLDLLAETKLASISNLKFKRKFRLKEIISDIKIISFISQIKIFVYFITGINFSKNSFFFTKEISFNKYNKLKVDKKIYENILFGYWQTEKYFSKYTKEIENNIILPLKGSSQFNEFMSLIKGTNSVAICVRIYEELPNDKSIVGGEEDLEFYKKAVDLILKNVPNPTFFIFSQKKYSIIKNLNLRGNVIYILGEESDFDEIYNLSLISNCKSHIISNSSYYWWGAWLSEKRNISKNIYTSSKFSNLDAIPDRWKKI